MTEMAHTAPAILGGIEEAIHPWISTLEGGFGWAGIAAAFALSGLVIIPRPALCILAGIAIGLYAFPLAVIATTAGSWTAFLLARHLFRDRFFRILERRPAARSLADAIDREGWRLLSLLRLGSPIPGPVANYAFGLSSIRPLPYVVTTALGIAPQVFAFVYLGAVARVAIDAEQVTSLMWLLNVGGAAVLLLAITLLTRRSRRSLSSRMERSASQRRAGERPTSRGWPTPSVPLPELPKDG
jgi:uncharacterized membrane protein YdjX (TVP38/TMEM64 family)